MTSDHANNDIDVVDAEIVDGEAVDDEQSSRLATLLDAAVARMKDAVAADIARLRDRHPDLDRGDLAQLVVKRGTRRVGWASAATGFGGLATTAVNIPSVLALQAGLVLGVAEVYGELDSDDIRQDFALILGGQGAAGALRNFGVAAANDFTKKYVQRNVTRETMKKVNSVISRKIITKAGEKSLTSFTKLVPVVGAGVGYTFDRSYARLLGQRALRYYGGE